MALTYSDRLKIYKEEYEIWGFERYSDQTKLISLTCQLTKAARTKDPNVTPFTLLAKMNSDMKRYAQLYQCISYQADTLIQYGTKFESYGYTKASEMVGEIKRILDEWIPF